MTNYDVHNPPMMGCGHAANASDSDGNPTCVICVGIVPGATTVATNPPDLSGRMARCSYRTSRGNQPHGDVGLVPSSTSLAFFNHRPDQAEDEYYCGCWGWD